MRDAFFINDHYVCFYYDLLLLFVEWELLGEISFFFFFFFSKISRMLQVLGCVRVCVLKVCSQMLSPLPKQCK